MKTILNVRLEKVFTPKQLIKLKCLLAMIESESLPTSTYKVFPKGVWIIRFGEFRLVGLKKDSSLQIVKVIRATDARDAFKYSPVMPVPAGRALFIKKIARKVPKGGKTRSGSKKARSSPGKIGGRKISPLWRAKINEIFGETAGQALAGYVLMQGANSWMQVLKWIFAK